MNGTRMFALSHNFGTRVMVMARFNMLFMVPEVNFQNFMDALF